MKDDAIMREACRSTFLKALPGKDVLEIGCGPGVDSHFLSVAGLTVTATDFSDEFYSILLNEVLRLIKFWLSPNSTF